MTEIKLFKRCSNLFFLPISFLILFLLVRHNSDVTESVIYATKLCVTSIIPSIFPFFIFADYLGAQQYNGATARTVSRIFGVSENCTPALICGLICGFPCGVKWALKLYEEGLISKTELEALMGLVNQPSLAFTVCAVGIGMLGSIKDGVFLYFSIIISVLISSRFLEFNNYKITKTDDIFRQSFNLTESIKNAGFSSLIVSSYIIFFSIVIKAFSFFIYPQSFLALISSFLEIGNATFLISNTSFSNPPLQNALLGFSLGFSGLSVHLQAFSLLPPNTSKKQYYKLKISQGILCAILFALYKCI